MVSKHNFPVLTIFFFILFIAWQGFAEISFIEPAKLNTNAATDLANDDHIKLATDGAGLWVAVWCAGTNPVSSLGDDPGSGLDGKNQDLFFARSLDNGRTWSTPALLKSNAATDDGDDTEPDLATDGQGNWIVVWRSMDTLNGTIGHDCDILYVQSTDNGLSWSDPAALNMNAASDPGNLYSGDPSSADYSPCIAQDGQGHWVATWSNIDNRSGSWISSIQTAYSSDLGVHWSQPITIQQFSGFAVDRTSIATDSKGCWIACWGYPYGGHGDSDIMFASSNDNGATWTTAMPLNSNAQSDSGNDVTPALTTDGQGHWVATWSSMDTLSGTIGSDWDILVSRSSDNGQSWSAPAVLNQDASQDLGADRFVHTLTDGQGNWLSLWSTTNMGDDTDVVYAVSHDEGSNWSTPSAVNISATNDTWSDGNGPFSASVATDQSGRWIVAWSSDNDLNGATGSDRDILFAIDNSPELPRVSVLSPNGGEQFNDDSPMQVSWRKNLAYAGQEMRVELWKSGKRFWDMGYISTGDADSTSTIQLPILPEGADYKVRLISTKNPALWDESDEPFTIHSSEISFIEPATLNTNASIDLAHDDWLKLATDGAGTWLAIWGAGINPVSSVGDDPGGGLDGKNQDLYYARSLDNGRTWSAPALLKSNSSTDDGDDTEPDMATDGQGNWIVVWRSMDTLNGTIGHDRDIMFVQSKDNGNSWSDPAALNANAENDPGNSSPDDPGSADYSPRIATDRQGHWVATWSNIDNRSGSWNSSIKAAYSNDLGENWSQPITLKQVSGLAVDRTALATDSKGRWIACWGGYPASGDSDIMYTISENNGVGWTTAIPLNSNASSDTGNDVTPALTTDGQGHWVATWSSTDSLNGTIGSDWDILVSHSTDNGQSWSAPAALNHNATQDSGTDRFVHTVTDGQGNWLSIWTTTNWGGDSDIAYAISQNNGANWSVSSPVHYSSLDDTWSDGNGPFSASVATDQSGRWIVAWSSDNDLNGTTGADRDILFAIDKSLELPRVSVLSPNGGEQFNDDSPMQVSWRKNLAYAGQEMRVELWKSGKRFWDMGYISTGDADSTSTIQLPLLPEGVDYKVRLISTKNPALWDESDEPFTIHGNIIKFDFPPNGVTWISNSTPTVHWKANISIVGTALKFELWYGNVRVKDLGPVYAQTGDEYSMIKLPSIAPRSGYKLRAISYWDPTFWADSEPVINIISASTSTISGNDWQLYR